MALPPLAPPCGRSVFAGRSLRVVDNCSTDRFIPYNEITKDKIADCPILADIRSLDPTLYLATYSGFPGLVKGCGYGSGMLVFSENMKYYTRVSDARVAGNKIKFEYGSNEIKENRADCWEFCVKRERVNIIVPIVRNEVVNYEFKLSRPEDKHCPICYEDLSGNVVQCTKGHQTCLKCFNLLPTIGAGQTIKKCVLCNESGYTIDEYKKVEQMNGAIVEGPAFFSISLDGANSYREFCNNEALFMGMIKNFVDINNLDLFPKMLLSSLYNYYMNHGGVAGAERIAGAAVGPTGIGAAVEGQELGAAALQPCGHLHLAVAHGEMHQGTAGKGEQRLGRLAGGPGVAVGLVLPHRIGDRLGVVGLELHGGHRDAIEHQHQIEAVLVAGGVAHLPHHPQAVGVVAGQDRRIETKGRLELGELEGLGQAEHLHAVAQQIEGAELIKLAPHPLQQRGAGLGAVIFLQHLPGIGLGLLHPGDQIGRVEGELAVVGVGAAFLVDPAVEAEVLANLALEGDFVVEAHRLSSCTMATFWGAVYADKA